MAFVLALVHGLGTGSDARAPWALAVYAVSAVLVGALIGVRALPPSGRRAHPIVAGVAASALIVGAYWTWLGPLQPGWNTIANDGHGSGGTIAAVAAADSTKVSSAEPSASPSPSPAKPQAFSDSLTGQLAQAEDGSVVLGASLNVSGDQLTLRFPSASDGRLLVDGATVTLLAPNGDTCAGKVQGLDHNRLVAACQGASSGSTWLLRIAVSAGANGAVQGSIQAVAN